MREGCFETMGERQGCDDVMQLRQREYGPNKRPLIVEFRSEYNKWTVMRKKLKLRESE